MPASKGSKDHLNAASLWNPRPRSEFRAGTLSTNGCKNTAGCRVLAAICQFAVAFEHDLQQAASSGSELL